MKQLKHLIKTIWVKNIYPIFHRGWSTWDGYEYFKYLPKKRRISVTQTHSSDKTKWIFTFIDLESGNDVSNDIKHTMRFEIMKHIKMLPKKFLGRIAYFTIENTWGNP